MDDIRPETLLHDTEIIRGMDTFLGLQFGNTKTIQRLAIYVVAKDNGFRFSVLGSGFAAILLIGQETIPGIQQGIQSLSIFLYRKIFHLSTTSMYL